MCTVCCFFNFLHFGGGDGDGFYPMCAYFVFFKICFLSSKIQNNFSPPQKDQFRNNNTSSYIDFILWHNSNIDFYCGNYAILCISPLSQHFKINPVIILSFCSIFFCLFLRSFFRENQYFSVSAKKISL